MSLEFWQLIEQNLKIKVYFKIELNNPKRDIQANSIRQLFSIEKGLILSFSTKDEN